MASDLAVLPREDHTQNGQQRRYERQYRNERHGDVGSGSHRRKQHEHCGGDNSEHHDFRQFFALLRLGFLHRGNRRNIGLRAISLLLLQLCGARHLLRRVLKRIPLRIIVRIEHLRRVGIRLPSIVPQLSSRFFGIRLF